MSGVKGKSGRKKEPKQALKEALDYLADAMPELYVIYTDVAKDGKHVDLFQYLSDRLMGRTHTSLDHRIKVVVGFTADDYELMTRLPASQEQALLAEFAESLIDTNENDVVNGECGESYMGDALPCPSEAVGKE